MGAQLRVVRRRIRTVQATKKITKAMELIAASRIVKAQNRLAATRPYTIELSRALTAAASNADVDRRPPAALGAEADRCVRRWWSSPPTVVSPVRTRPTRSVRLRR